mgnify:CR=1 FL=1
MTPKMDTDWWTLAEANDYLKIKGPEQLAVSMRNGLIPKEKMVRRGPLWFIHKSAVLNYDRRRQDRKVLPVAITDEERRVLGAHIEAGHPNTRRAIVLLDATVEGNTASVILREHMISWATLYMWIRTFLNGGQDRVGALMASRPRGRPRKPAPDSTATEPAAVAP